jgi:hypothetical protein
MLYYIPDLVVKTTCIGNALSTMNISFSSLDTNLYNLSTYTVNSVNYLSATMISVSATLNSRINFLSATMISVSSTLTNNINFVSAYSTNVNNKVDVVSSSLNDINDYVTNYIFSSYDDPLALTTTADGATITINFSTITNGTERHNANIVLGHNIILGNFNGATPGQSGSIVVFVASAGKSISGYGNQWVFNGTSAISTTLSARNLIRYYVHSINNNTKILAELKTF